MLSLEFSILFRLDPRDRVEKSHREYRFENRKHLEPSILFKYIYILYFYRKLLSRSSLTLLTIFYEVPDKSMTTLEEEGICPGSPYPEE